MKYLAWYKGYSKYTTYFIVLVTAARSTVVNSNVGTGDHPPPPTPTPRQTIRQMFTSLYTNNSQVYYKGHSLASGGVGTVRNSRSKARRT